MYGKKSVSAEETARIIESDVKKDLHIHSFYSDGRLSPEEIIDAWSSEGYELISITDHDGIDGSLSVIEYAQEKEICLIPGIEFDSADPLGRDMHILGYGLDYDSPELKESLNGILLERADRGVRELGGDYRDADGGNLFFRPG